LCYCINMTNSMKYTPRDADAALRGNMDRCLVHAANGQSKVGLTRREVIRAVREARPEVAEYKPRVANVRRLPSVNGFHVIGLGQVQQVTLNELKTKLGVNGFTGYRVGGLTFKLFGK
jgi:hypothetical protein